MELLKLIRSRRTIRKFKNKAIPRAMVIKIIEAGRWAPSAHNLQPWKFVVISNKNKIKNIADILDKNAYGLFAGFNIVMRDTARNIKKAPVLLAIYSTELISKKFRRLGHPYSGIGTIYEIQSIACAIENILLYIHSLGLGAAWYGMALFCETEINRILKQSNKLHAIISFGYQSETLCNSKRIKLSKITEFFN